MISEFQNEALNSLNLIIKMVLIILQNLNIYFCNLKKLKSLLYILYLIPYKYTVTFPHYFSSVFSMCRFSFLLFTVFSQ